VTLYKAKKGRKRSKKKVASSQGYKRSPNFHKVKDFPQKVFFSRVDLGSIPDFTRGVFSLTTFFDLVSLPTSSQAQKDPNLSAKTLQTKICEANSTAAEMLFGSVRRARTL
jgi:hypothetical protein